MRVEGVGVAAEDVRGAAAHVLGVRGVLEREQAEETLLGLLVEVVAAVGDGEEVPVLVAPLQVRHAQLPPLRVQVLLLLGEGLRVSTGYN